MEIVAGEASVYTILAFVAMKTVHCVRHTWATLALEAGRSVRWVADVLGHADPALTLRVYTHAIRVEETDLSFADFGGRRRARRRLWTAPRLGEHSDSATDEDDDAATSDSDFADFGEEDPGGPGQRSQPVHRNGATSQTLVDPKGRLNLPSARQRMRFALEL